MKDYPNINDQNDIWISEILNTQIKHLKSKLIDYYKNNEQFKAFDLNLCQQYFINKEIKFNIDKEMEFNNSLEEMNNIVNTYEIIKSKIIILASKLVNNEKKMKIIDSLDNTIGIETSLKSVLNSFFIQFPIELTEKFIRLHAYMYSKEHQLFKKDNYINIQWYMNNLGKYIFVYIIYLQLINISFIYPFY